ncbi:MAG: COX15/CtaA family protein [Candidatus Zixiibacteriota bacterium]|nr:MAG: COX15/CtaA family protein [candidate division Zixibacteria bacterium]
MKSFRRFAFVATIATYLLIFTGGLVRVSGAGLGCPDWPRCFGRWLPPTSVEQLPPDIDPAQFNFVLAWIEYGNRLLGMLVGLLILITAIWALNNFRRNPHIVIPAVAAAVLTAIEGWQGSVVIASHLQPLVVSVHTVLALVIAGLMVYLTAEAYRQEKKPAVEVPPGTSRWLAILWLVAVVQVVLGTQMRQTLEVLREQYPLMAAGGWVTRMGVLNHAHMTLGVLLAAFSLTVALSLWKFRDRFPPLLIQSVAWFVVLALAQLLSGLLFVFFEITPLIQVFHLWLAGLFVGVCLMLYAMTKQRQVAK